MCNFFHTLVGVLFISINVESTCRQVSLFTLTHSDCDSEHTSESRKIMEYQPFYQMEEINRYYKCSLAALELIEDGEFLEESMEGLIRKHVDSEATVAKLLARFKKIASKATAMAPEEDSDDRARIFAQLNYEAEIQEHLLMGYYCSEEKLE